MSIAKRIQKARSALDITQQEAARVWGISVRTLEAWEAGRHEPRGFARVQLNKLLSDILGDARGRNR